MPATRKTRDPGKAARQPWNRPVFVFAVGRSGSTLLMRLLNCMEGLTVWGEHAGIVQNLAASYHTLTGAPYWNWIEKARAGSAALIAKQPLLSTVPDQMTGEWMNHLDREDLLAASRNYLVRLFAAGLPRDRRWGFKEIRYRRRELDFLRLLFPGAQFIVLLRDPADVAASQLRSFHRGDAKHLPAILETIGSYLAFAADVAGAALPGVRLLDYSGLVHAPDRSVRMLERFLRDQALREDVRAIRAEREPAPPSPYDAGGEAAVAAALAALFRAGGKAPPVEGIARCAAAYHQLRLAIDASSAARRHGRPAPAKPGPGARRRA